MESCSQYNETVYWSSSMKRKTCPNCFRPLITCYCHTLSQLVNCWPVHILQHEKEHQHPLNTARIVQLSLSRCQTTQLIDGEKLTNKSFDPQTTILIYPTRDAQPLDSLKNGKEKTLLFLDGSWRKTRRMLYENPELNELPKIAFHPDTVSRYRIRKSPLVHGLSTLESVVLILSQLEGDIKKYQPLLNSMDWLIDKQIELMGEEVYRRYYLHDKPTR